MNAARGLRYVGRPIDEPAGPRRRNAMARSKDQLEQDIEERGEETGLRSLKDVKLENEIVSQFNSLRVSRADSEYVYGWFRFKAPFGGVAPIDEKLCMTITVEGRAYPCWEIVKGAMKEAWERRQVDGTRCIGDVMLCRCRKDVYKAIEKWEQTKRQMREAGPGSELQSLGDRHGVDVRVADIAISKRGIDDPVMRRALKHAAANEMANRQLDHQIRSGRVRGMEVDAA